MATTCRISPIRALAAPRAHRALVVMALLWLAMVVSALCRPLLPIGETRYVSVAWEMWAGHHFWVPVMNGAPYADKPPLLFWLIHAGWAVFGVNAWWPRLISPLASLLALVQLYRIARGLGYAPAQARWAPLVLLTLLLWQLYSGALMFDVLLSACLLGAIAPLVSGAFDARRALACGLWLGAALLAKGPVALVTFLPILATSPCWRAEPLSGAQWRRVLGALGLGSALLLGWALTAAWAGGGEFARMLLWGQTVDRLHDSMAHARPWWWYLPWLVVLLFPWSLWPSAWPGLPRRRHQRLAWFWTLPALAVFSLISGKQVHYLMPVLPGVALLVMDRLTRPSCSGSASMKPASLKPVALALAGLGVAVSGALVFGVGAVDTTLISPFGAVLLIGLGALLWYQPARNTLATARTLAVACTASVVIVVQVMLFPLWQRESVIGPAELIGSLQREGVPVAYVGGNYQATFQFAGRLRTPLAPVSDSRALCRFRTAHPEGWAVGRTRTLTPWLEGHALRRTFLYRSGTLVVLPIGTDVRPNASESCP
ncbi:ArnT family glycosyltransferase [Larsenimonas salina]|uniref:ArnT family glycosyltransferase n=1 Tax=Larsenimonas salina TaxID=1295565 RepID=UPI00207395B7|nr:glycosyltransferase family 39 protein [Larsenimonas salina]MCM5705118.1 glycosyltransferase family 39 protein [Larsenimonas salina]